MDINSILIKEIEENFPVEVKELAIIILSELNKNKSNRQIEEIILEELRESFI
ncbi:hypothetical protein EV215_0314 [Hypnocyclicus thermotrophus]|uniref:Uncharacterized protein n=1 Tax=Hypnocyclicus thermotrophus TaxID=1627895 RepID=A0AA46I6F9_9FUSO|nr:hypothetical protein [Hypnocyclicus thermotrophus]TDT72504.1 hypothetical protein EV215_0314 [Hypnocyclicus thermotrophus]